MVSLETGYRYSGMRLFLEKEDWILYMDYRNSIWIQRNWIFSGKPKLDPVHVWYHKVKIWIQWNRILSEKKKKNWMVL